MREVKTLGEEEQMSVGFDFDLEALHWPDKGPSSSSLLTHSPVLVCRGKGSSQLLRLL